MKPRPKHKFKSASTDSTNHKMFADKQTKIGLSAHKVQAGLTPEEWEVITIGEIAETMGGGGMRQLLNIK